MLPKQASMPREPKFAHGILCPAKSGLVAVRGAGLAGPKMEVSMTAHIATSAAKNATLTDTAVMILSAAARRNDRLLFPLPKSMTSSPKIVKKTIEGLISKSLAEERPAKLQDTVWREDEEERKFTVLITDQGIAALENPRLTQISKRSPGPLRREDRKLKSHLERRRVGQRRRMISARRLRANCCRQERPAKT